jgi:hypothetical protein
MCGVNREEKCVFCGAVKMTDAAIDAGWIPEYFDARTGEYSGPVCPLCQIEYHIYWDEEYECYEILTTDMK